MKRAWLLAATTLAAAPLGAQVAAPVVPADASATAPLRVTAPPGAKVWIGRYAEYERYLHEAPVARIESVPVGVTRPKRAFFEPGGLARAAIVKPLPMGQRSGFWEAYKSEVAAYELDRMLGLDMVPVTVERRVGGDLASVQLWVEDSKLLKEIDQTLCPRPMEWAKQVCRQRVFDNLVANIDRNAGNMLVDGEWNIILIDHSRAFAADRMPFEKEMTRIDRELFERMKALDQAGLMQRIRPWVLGDGPVKGILKRRDKIVAHFEKLARERGEASVFPF
jgi:hypothetical protein